VSAEGDLTANLERVMNVEQVRHIVDIAIQRFLSNDCYLLETDGSERTMTYMLSRYLAEQLPDWAVDCEYNRDRNTIKRLCLEQGRKETYRVPKRVSVMPDIIVHHRGTNDNLLVIEAKKSSSGKSIKFDLYKLREYVEQFHYGYALFLKFIVGDEPDVEQEWIEV
jgi:hypothetical protein